MAAELVAVRHADTAWTVSGQHTGRTDIPLSDDGRVRARALAPRLSGQDFVAVWSSPLSRALETASLAGFEPVLREELMEWDYGRYEGLTSAQIDELAPGWSLWRDGCPGGESAADVGARADALLASLPAEGVVLAFAHGHVLRVLIARWLGLAPADGALFVLAPGGIASLGHEHGQRTLRGLG
jgi:probable phosphoglycerate mutase